MAYWLYQLSVEEEYYPSAYRKAVIEGKQVEWTLPDNPRIYRYDKPEPNSGDKIILFFCKTGFRQKGKASGIRGKPGVYGVGTITYFNRDSGIDFMPESPTDKLKVRPLWNGEIDRLIDRIRGKTPQGTMWIMKDGQFKTYERLLDEWLASENEQDVKSIPGEEKK
jgi:hypothetical protein